METQKLMEFAVERHLQGDLDQAGNIYRQVLQADPGVADAWNLAGVLAHQTGQHATGVEYIAHAIELQDDVPSYYLNLATALMGQKRAVEAEHCARKCLELDENHTLAWNVLGNALQEQEQLDLAVQCFQRAIGLDENHIDAWVNLGRLYRETGKLEAAEQCTRRGLRLDPKHYTALNNLGAIKRSQREYSEALELFEQMAKQQPESARLMVNRGNTLQDLGRYHEAEEAFLAAVEMDPTSANAWNSLGFYYQCLAQVDNALDCYRHSLQLHPNNSTASSNYLFGLNLAGDIDRATCYQEHVRIGHALSPETDIRLERPVDPDRRLRVGYVSPDLFRHPMMGFFEPLLQHHDREQVEVVCYANVRKPDDVTDRLRAQSDRWHHTFGKSDADVLQLIRNDQIDILIDLAGHTAGNRLRTMAHRAAPIQASMLGYLNTTGVDAIDYYISDAIRDPAEEDEYYVEQVVRLPGGGCCWNPTPDAPEVVSPPALERGYVTFGSTHRPNKLTDETLDLWAGVLRTVEDSRLLLFHNTIRDSPELQGQLLRRFADRGIDPQRVDIAWDSPGVYLTSYAEMDILLEAIPWSSGTTALESMWMGVPIPTLRGRQPCGRTTASALQRLQLPELVATDEQHYQRLVVELAGDLDRLVSLRQEFRDRMRGSICDASQFVQQLEAAYREMWKTWCESA